MTNNLYYRQKLVEKGLVNRKTVDYVERIAEKFTIDDKGCWIWQASKNPKGYGRIVIQYKAYQVHRYLYESMYGEVPKELDMDHLCRVPSCINPKHLEPVTRRENVRRGVCVEVIKAKHAKLTHCKWGHEINEKNYWYSKRHNERRCRPCFNRKAREKAVALRQQVKGGES